MNLQQYKEKIASEILNQYNHQSNIDRHIMSGGGSFHHEKPLCDYGEQVINSNGWVGGSIDDGLDYYDSDDGDCDSDCSDDDYAQYNLGGAIKPKEIIHTLRQHLGKAHRHIKNAILNSLLRKKKGHRVINNEPHHQGLAHHHHHEYQPHHNEHHNNRDDGDDDKEDTTQNFGDDVRGGYVNVLKTLQQNLPKKHAKAINKAIEQLEKMKNSQANSGAGIFKSLKKIGHSIGHALENQGSKIGSELINQGAKQVMKQITNPQNVEMAEESAGGMSDKMRRRSILVKKLMKSKGLSLPEASKYIKQNNLKY